MTVEQERKERPYMLALLGGMGLLIGIALLLRARVKPIWFDELFTYYAARRESVGEVARALLDGADNLPPLDAIIRHFSMSLLGPGEIGFRLPSVVWFLLGSWWVYRAVLRVSGSRLAAVAAFLVPTSSVAFEIYAVEGRPYVALFAVAAGALSAWSSTLVHPKGYLADIQLALLLAAAIPLHYYGVTIPVAIAFGELVRLLVGGKFRVRTLLAGLFAVGLGLTLLPFVEVATKHASVHAWAPAKPGLIFWHFKVLLAPLIVPTTLGLAAVWALVALRWPRRRDASPEMDAVSSVPPAGWIGGEQAYVTVVVRPFIAGAIALVLTPAMVFVISLVTTANTDRYSLPMVAGAAVLVGLALAAIAERHRPAALAVLGALVLVGAYRAAASAKTAAGEPLPGPVHGLDAIIERYDHDPIVVETPHLYFQEYHYIGEPRRRRLVRPLDVKLAVQYMGYDSDELALLDLRSTIDARFPDWSDFLADNPQFLLVSSNDGWMLPWLIESGASLKAIDRTLKSVVYRVDASGIVTVGR